MDKLQRSEGRHRLEIEPALVFFIRLYPLLQPPSSGEAWFGNAFDAKAGHCEQAAAQDAIAGKRGSGGFAIEVKYSVSSSGPPNITLMIFLTGCR